MNVIAIIAEYNPFHTGHHYLIQQIRRQFPHAPILIMMSGSFVQRGEPALFDKWHRASWAIQCGADGVFELPAVYALSHAAEFAAGAVRLASRLGCTHLACGVESGTATDFFTLAQAAQSVAAPSVSTTGKSYGQGLSDMLQQLVSPRLASLVTQPNALLALEYTKSMLRYAPSMHFIPIQRQGHHDSPCTTDTYISASALRHQIIKTGTISPLLSYIPTAIQQEMLQCISQGTYTDYTRYADYILYENRLLTTSDLQQLAAFSEGLENRWHRCLSQATSWPEALTALKTRRYAYSRLCRMGAYTMLHISQPDMNIAYQKGPAYGRILALSATGAAVIKNIKHTFPMITKVKKAWPLLSPYGQHMLQYDLRCTDMQFLCFHQSSQRHGLADYYTSPRIL